MVHSSFREETPSLVISETSSKGTPKDRPVFIDNANEHFVNDVKQRVSEMNRQMNGELAKEPDYEYPCVDISSWMDPSGNKVQRELVLNQVIKQAMEAGSFNITGHGIPQDLLDRMGSQSKKFFEMPLEEKQKFTVDEHKGGYLAVQSESGASVLGKSENEKENRDLREVFSHVYPPSSEMNVKPPEFYGRPVAEYLEAMTKLDCVINDILTAALAKAKGVSLPKDLFNVAKGGATGVIRCSRYPKMPAEYDGARKLCWHSDWGTFTIIYSEASGLEEIRDGKAVLLPVKRGQLHIVIGEMIALWSNGLFKSNVHCVSPQAKDDRISYTYFAGQGEKGDFSMGPVCANGEDPRFGETSASMHVDKYCQIYFNS